MANSTTNLDLISVNQAQKEVTANALFDAVSASALFGRRASTCVGLTWGYYGGPKNNGGTIVQIANGTILLTASTTNYLEIDNAGVLYKVTGSPTVGRLLMYTIVTGTNSVTSYTDHRNGTQGLDFAFSLGTVAASSVSIVDAGGYYTATNVETALQEVATNMLPQTETVAYSATLTLNADNYKHEETITITLTGNLTLNITSSSNTPDGKSLLFRFIQGSPGNRLVTLNTGFAFGADITSFTASTATGKIDYVGVKFYKTSGAFHVLAVNKGF